jgi:hypothetical protein
MNNASNIEGKQTTEGGRRQLPVRLAFWSLLATSRLASIHSSRKSVSTRFVLVVLLFDESNETHVSIGYKKSNIETQGPDTGFST